MNRRLTVAVIAIALLVVWLSLEQPPTGRTRKEGKSSAAPPETAVEALNGGTTLKQPANGDVVGSHREAESQPTPSVSADTVFGHVYGADGKGVKDVPVRLIDRPGLRSIGTTPATKAARVRVGESVTDAAGYFAIPATGCGTYELQVSWQGDACTVSAAPCYPGVAESIWLAELGSVMGEVVSTDGQPLEAELVISSRVGGLEKRTLSAPDGRYVFDCLEPGEYWLACYRASFEPAGYSVDVRPRGSVRRDATLTPGAVIHGVVVEADFGRPIGGASVRILGRPKTLAATTDEEGRFTLEGATRLSHEDLQVLAQGYAPMEERVVTGDELERREVTLRLRRGGTIEGTVRLESGEAVAGAAVTGHSYRRENEGLQRESWHEATTTDSGYYQLTSVRLDLPLVLTAQQPKYGTQVLILPPQGVDADASVVRRDLVLGPAVKIDGVVLDSRGLAMQGQNVEITKGLSQVPRVARDLAWATRLRTKTSKDGRFAFEGMALGDYDIKLVAGAETQTRALTVTDCKRVEEVVFRVKQDGTLAGHVLLQDGEPARGAGVRVLDVGAEVPIAYAAVGPAGDFRISGLQRDKAYTVDTYFADGYSAATREFGAAARLAPVFVDNEQIVLRLPRPRSIRGRVILPDGPVPPETVIISAYHFAERYWLDGAIAGHDGEFTLRVPENATISVEVSAPGYRLPEALELGPEDGNATLSLVRAEDDE